MPSGTIDPSIGRATAIAIKKEDTWGEEGNSGTGGWAYLPQTGNDPTGEIDRLEDPTILNTRASQPSLAGTRTITGGVDLSVDAEKIGYPLYHTLGGYNVASGSNADWTHNFYGTDLDNVSNKIPPFSVMRHLDSFDIRLKGGRANTLSFDQSQNSVFTASWDIQTHSEEKASTGVPTIANINTDPLKYRDGSINIDTDISAGGGEVSVATIQDVSFEISNNLDGNATINSGEFVGWLRAFTREITGSMTILYSGSKFFDAYTSDNDLSMTLQWDADVNAGSSSNAKYFKAEFPLVKLTTAPISVDGGDSVVTQDVDFEARYKSDASGTLADGTSLVGYDALFELYNDTAESTYNTNT